MPVIPAEAKRRAGTLVKLQQEVPDRLTPSGMTSHLKWGLAAQGPGSADAVRDDIQVFDFTPQTPHGRGLDWVT